MCPPLPTERGQIKLRIIFFPTLWKACSRFLFFLLFLGCGCGRIVKPYAAERQAGLLFNTIEESQMNSIKPHLGIGHYCESSGNAQLLEEFWCLQGPRAPAAVSAMAPHSHRKYPAKTGCFIVSSCVHEPSILLLVLLLPLL